MVHLFMEVENFLSVLGGGDLCRSNMVRVANAEPSLKIIVQFAKDRWRLFGPLNDVIYEQALTFLQDFLRENKRTRQCANHHSFANERI